MKLDRTSNRKRPSTRTPLAFGAFFSLGMLALACGGRPEGWERPFVAGDVVGLQTSVAVIDEKLDRAIVLESPGPLDLRATYLPIGKKVATTVASPQRDRLFALSQGVQPRRKTTDELPRLTVIDTVPEPAVSRTYDLSDPFSGLSLDPLGQWAIVHAGAGVIENPNEIILVDLDDPEAEPTIKSIRSFGGRPAHFTFTAPLTIADEEPRRILIVQTEQDLTLIDLARLGDSEITVLTPESESGRFSEPKFVAFHDADQGSDPVLAVSFANSASVLLIRLVAGNRTHAFLPEINSIIDVGGRPSAIEFVQTDGGLRLAALVPTARHAALVDPKTTTVDLVPMPAAFSGLTLITDSLDAGSATDFALLWAEQQGVVGIWSLAAAVGAPYNSIDTFGISVGVQRVLDVPGPAEGACPDAGRCYAQYKILEGTGAGNFYLLDLELKEASLMVTNDRKLELSLSPDGQRLWAFAERGVDFAQVGFSNLHPVSLSAEAPIGGVFDVGRPNGGGDGRSAIVLHTTDGLAATVFDGVEPDGAVTRFYSGLAYGGLSR